MSATSSGALFVPAETFGPAGVAIDDVMDSPASQQTHDERIQSTQTELRKIIEAITDQHPGRTVWVITCRSILLPGPDVSPKRRAVNEMLGGAHLVGPEVALAEKLHTDLADEFDRRIRRGFYDAQMAQAIGQQADLCRRAVAAISAAFRAAQPSPS